jgi:hypothetical protein
MLCRPDARLKDILNEKRKNVHDAASSRLQSSMLLV